MKFAAGVLPFCPSTKRFLVAKRGPNITNPNQWTNFGGGSEDGENPVQTAIREFREESGYRGKVKLIKSYPTKNSKDGITFFNFIGLVPDEFKPTTIGKKTVDGNVEVSAAKWLTIEQLYNLSPGILHPGFFKFLNLANNQLHDMGLNEMNSLDKLKRLVENIIAEEMSNFEIPEDPPAFTVDRNPDAEKIWNELTSVHATEINKISRRYQKMIFDNNYTGISIGYLKFLVDKAKKLPKNDMSAGTFNSKDYRIGNILRTKDSSGKTKSRKW